ncbi:hypothetical protein K431DRAFT_313004 [Polychaeton citri CBS 116435]|uniref:Zn(2)-C6 fungal-type domain-containing protein n=1 Tax=Polychaeton citri CBS 116435 TaxID=1314669 RepID=A0A9P4UPY3_9PEZI|nr:hypothetical protein K431DRAFT_313004 [Polychaeton citri CBS 116435]
MASSWSGYGPSAHASNQAEGDKRKKPQQRQLLSCTKCRERKVKCDRTKPCSACCARGHPRECEFIVGEGNDYSPIQQSYEIRKLRAENQRLRERLRDGQSQHSGDGGEDGDDHDSSRDSKRATVARQRRFRTGDRSDNLYFGSPGLANIISDFASLHIHGLGHHSLTHPLPRGRDIYQPSADGPHRSSYPFATLWYQGADIIPQLLKTLPDKAELISSLDMFQHKAQSCSFPHVPDNTTKREVLRFLDDAEENAEKHPDMLALVFATLATGLQLGVYDRNGSLWVRGTTETAMQQADVYLAACMQALRMASFMNQPTLLGVQALVMLGPYLTNSGRFLDAWTLFGTTIRMAHSIGLHRNPKLLDPSPSSTREVMIRQSLWWWMLHMDQQYSVTLGRPLGISGYGDCPPPEPLTTDPTILRLAEFVDHFTILARQILNSDGMMKLTQIDEYTDKLLGLWDTMPEALQFNESWCHQETTLPEWPLDVMSASLSGKVHSYIILLNRQRIERSSTTSASENSPTSGHHHLNHDHGMHPAPIRGRRLVINSSISLLHIFLFFQHRKPAVLICWTIGQQAFNACMILILDALETGNTGNEFIINQAYVLFTELSEKGVHKLAHFAVQRIADGLARLEQKRQDQQNIPTASSPKLDVQLAFEQSAMGSDGAATGLVSGTVMGNSGMFLLEDAGMQALSQQQAFQPLVWSMAGIFHSASSPGFPSSTTVSHRIPVSQVQATPFPVISPSYVPTNMPVTGSPYALGLQPRMLPGTRAKPTSSAPTSQHLYQTHMHGGERTAFTPINPIYDHGGSERSFAQQAHSSQRHGQQRFARTNQGSEGHHRNGYGGHAQAASLGPRGIQKGDRPHRKRT